MVRVFSRRNQDVQFVPQPLSGSGEVEVVSFDGEAIDERHFSSGGMAGIAPVAGFQQDRPQQANLNYFASDAVDLDPIAARIPWRPISTNHPKNATMKSLRATVSPAPANAKTVES